MWTVRIEHASGEEILTTQVEKEAAAQRIKEALEAYVHAEAPVAHQSSYRLRVLTWDEAAEGQRWKEALARHSGNAMTALSEYMSGAPLLTVGQAAEALQMSEQSIRRLAGRGTLVARKHGRDWMIEEASVHRYSEQDRRPGRPQKTQQR